MRKLLELSTSYIKGDRLIKYRYSSNDVTDMDYLLSAKAELKGHITDEEHFYLAMAGNLVIEKKGRYELINFDKEIIDNWELVDI